MPASSAKTIAEATARKEELETVQVREEEKLKEVMESLKEETSGLQQDKEVFEPSTPTIHRPRLPACVIVCLNKVAGASCGLGLGFM